MITRSFVVLGLLLILCCHQSHHHIFFLINPLTLASEEFIPNEPVSKENEAPVVNLDVGKEVQGSQNVKSDNDVPQTFEQVEKVQRTEVNEAPQTTQDANGNSGDGENKLSIDEDHPKKSQTTTPIPDAKGGNVPEANSSPGPTTSTNENDPPDNDLKITLEDSKNLESVLGESNGTNQMGIADTSATPATPTKIEIPIVTPTAPTPQKDEEPIPSFMEWTQLQQQKLHESNMAHQAVIASGQTNGHNGYKSQHATHSQLNKSSLAGNQMNAADKSRKESSTAKNFASPDCGAKVIQSNPESQNANGVLSSSHDEYMLNKCGIPIWFIVELCEPLKIEKVSIGNLELFSSSPKDIEIGISDRYPTRDWSKLGPFTLPDVRAIHSINFPASNASTFGKFLKVNILSHYGTEHFCPLSLVRVNGISEYEVLESENTHPEDIDESEKEESPLYEEPVIDQHQQSPDGAVADKSVFGSAKDVVINIVKKAAEVLVKSDRNKDTLPHLADAAVDSNCRSLLQCLPNYETQFHQRVLSFLSCNFSNMLPFLSKNSPWCGWDYCHALFSRHSIGLPWQPEGFYAAMFGGPSVLHALCNYHKPLSKESCDTMFSKNVSESSGSSILGEGYVNESVRSLPTASSTFEEPKEVKEPIQDDSPSSSENQDEDVKLVVEPKGETRPQSSLDPERSSHSLDDSASAAVPSSDTPAPGPPPSQHQGAPQNQGQGGFDDTTSQHHHHPPQNQQTSTSSQSQQQPPANSVQQQQQKESVFVRLSNRIKTLERNQTITASYLEELSRRFKKQNEENHHFNEGTKTFINESKLKFKLLEDAYKFELRSLRRNTEEIRERLFNVQLQRSLLILLCLVQFVAIMSVCIWIKRRFRYFESQLNNMTVEPLSIPPQPRVPAVPALTSSPMSMSSSCKGSPQHSSLLAARKRVNSDGNIGLNSIDKSKKIRKKKKKLPDLKPVSMKVSGPASAPIEYPTGSMESGFKFNYPPSAYDMSISKENVKPGGLDPFSNQLKYDRLTLPTTPQTSPNGSSGGVTLLATQVDSPFSMISSTSTNFFVDSTVSTSSRFALLASPGPGATTKSSSNMKRSGSLTSLDSSSTSSYSYGVKTGSNNVINGHGDSQSQGSGNSGKKRKNKGLKALMPKIFDSENNGDLIVVFRATF